MNLSAVIGSGVLGWAVYGTGSPPTFTITEQTSVEYEYDVLPVGRHSTGSRIYVAVPTDKTVYLKLRFFNDYLEPINAPYIYYVQNSDSWTVSTDQKFGRLIFKITTNNKGSINNIDIDYDTWRLQLTMVGT